MASTRVGIYSSPPGGSRRVPNRGVRMQVTLPLAVPPHPPLLFAVSSAEEFLAHFEHVGSLWT